MKKNLFRPWLKVSGVEKPTSELKEISKSWDEKTWNEYLDWFEVGRKDQLVSPTLYHIQGESIEKNIFEEFGYQSCPELRSFCDRLLRSVPVIQQQILRSIFFDGKTQREIAYEINRSKTNVTYNKNKAITTLKRVHGGEMWTARRIMRGTEVFELEKIESFWDQKLSHPSKDQRSYDQLNSNQELLIHSCAELREVFQKLSDRSRQIIYLKFWCELKTSEIARKPSMGLNAVEQIIDATVFKIKSQLVQNCTIQSNYRMAQVKTGIPYSGTHCLRHGMATLARKVGGMGLDSVVAMTGHKDLKLAAHYSKIDGEVQKETSLKILDHIQQLGFAEEAKLKQESLEVLEVNLGENVVHFRRAKGG